MSAGERNRLVSYQPGGWYYRQALRQTEDPEKLRMIGLMLAEEYELHRDFIRQLGEWPPIKYEPGLTLAQILGEPVRAQDDAAQLKLLPDPED